MLFSCYMAGAAWNCCRLGARFVHTIRPCTSLQSHFMQRHIRRVHACLAVTCHLHFRQTVWRCVHVLTHPVQDVGGHHGAGDGGEAARQHSVQLRQRHVLDEGPDHQRGFTLQTDRQSVSHPHVTGEQSPSRHWWTVNLTSLVKSRPHVTGEQSSSRHWWTVTLTSLGNSHNHVAGEQSPSCQWWTVTLMSLVNSHPYVTGEVTLMSLVNSHPDGTCPRPV